MQYLDIVDCNAGNHHKAFATNFNPEINIREITQNGRYYENGQWVTTQPLEIHKDLTYPNIGPRDSYLLYHEELESLVKNFLPSSVHVLDDFRSGIPDSPASNPEHRYGSYR